MSNLIPLEFEAKAIRTLEIEGVLWWALTDICAALGLSNPSRVAMRLDDDERSNFKLDRQNDVLFVNEGGLYSTMLRSKAATTPGTIPFKFRKWVANEVIPSIRKYGFYDPKRLNVKEVEKLEAEPFEAREKTPNERFWEEIKLYEARIGMDHIVGLKHIMSKQMLVSIKYGESIIKMMKKRDIWFYLAAMGFDIKYIVWGTKELTLGEKKIIAALRIGNKDARQMAIANAVQMLQLQENNTIDGGNF